MSLLRRTHHQVAEAHLDAAAGLMIAAGENVQLAAEANNKARNAHQNAIDYHSDRLAETQARDEEIQEALTYLAVTNV